MTPELKELLITAHKSTLEAINRRWEYLTLPLDERYKIMQVNIPDWTNTKIGYGDGGGYGYGSSGGFGTGYGSSDGFGTGYGNGTGTGLGDGNGYGIGFGDGDGSGYTSKEDIV
jgi:hypothetical protein